MNIEFLTEFFAPVIVGICLCVGYILKTATPINNKLIPAINGAIGLGVALWLYWSAITPEVILTGLFSGLAATGLYETFRNVIGGDSK